MSHGNQLGIQGIVNPDRPGVAKWTPAAHHCFNIHQDCKQCPLHTDYGIDPQECQIPKALSWLLANNVPIPASYFKPPRRKGGANVDNSPTYRLRID